MTLVPTAGLMRTILIRNILSTLCGRSMRLFIDEGAGEDMPSALVNLLPGYEEFPRGHTIGPVDNLRTLSSQDRIKYLLEKLPQFRALGWMTDEAVGGYEHQLKSNDLNAMIEPIGSRPQIRGDYNRGLCYHSGYEMTVSTVVCPQ